MFITFIPSLPYISHNQHNNKRTLLQPSFRIPQVQCVREVPYPPFHYVEPLKKALVRVHNISFIHSFIHLLLHLGKGCNNQHRPCELHGIRCSTPTPKREGFHLPNVKPFIHSYLGGSTKL